MSKIGRTISITPDVLPRAGKLGDRSSCCGIHDGPAAYRFERRPRTSNSALIATHFPDATPSVFHQRRIGSGTAIVVQYHGEDLHRYWAGNLARADALLFGRVTYEMMEAAWRQRMGVWPDWMTDWMKPLARTIDAAKRYVVSNTLDRVDWNAEFARGDHLGETIQQLKQESRVKDCSWEA
jgi:hypothetical protein